MKHFAALSKFKNYFTILIANYVKFTWIISQCNIDHYYTKPRPNIIVICTNNRKTARQTKVKHFFVIESMKYYIIILNY